MRTQLSGSNVARCFRRRSCWRRSGPACIASTSRKSTGQFTIGKDSKSATCSGTMTTKTRQSSFTSFCATCCSENTQPQVMCDHRPAVKLKWTEFRRSSYHASLLDFRGQRDVVQAGRIRGLGNWKKERLLMAFYLLIKERFLINYPALVKRTLDALERIFSSWL